MKAYELPIKLNEQGAFELPQSLKQALESGRVAKLFVLVEEAEDEERAWEAFAAREFFAGYSEADSIYDDQSESTKYTQKVLEKTS
jgi:hypothetical protein